MKNLLFGLIATFMFLTSFAHANDISSKISNTYNSINYKNLDFSSTIKPRTKHLEGDIILSGGCKVHYEIDITYTIIPPDVISIKGSITMSGNCSGTQTFNARVNTDPKGVISGVQTDLRDSNLQSAEFNEAFAKSLNEFQIFIN